MSAEPTERPWRRRLQRYGPWVVAAVAIAAILVKYPPERIAAEMTQGDLAGTVPYAALLVFGGIFLLSASDWLVINGAMQPPDEARVSYLHATRARAGMSLLGLLGYGASVGGVGVWIARVTASGAALAGGVALYLMATDLIAVSTVAAAAFWIGRPDVAPALGIVAPIIAAVLLLLALVGPFGLLVPREKLPRVFQPWSRIDSGRAALAVILRTVNICWITTMVWLGANAFGMTVPLGAMATFFPIILVVGISRDLLPVFYPTGTGGWELSVLPALVVAICCLILLVWRWRRFWRLGGPSRPAPKKSTSSEGGAAA